MTNAIEFVREGFTKDDNIRDAGLTTPEDIQRYDDIVYGWDAKWQVLDVYRPKSEEGKTLPVIVSVHGGGWVYGDKERYQFYCMSLAQMGFAVVNFTYRLSPEFQFPAPVEDTNLVFTWVLEHAEEYGFDREHIFGISDSVGANILGTFSAICTNEKLAEKYPFAAPEGFVPKAVVFNCGVYHIDMTPGGTSMDVMQDLARYYLPQGGTPEELDLLCFANDMTEAFPPAFFMTATGDFMLDETPILHKKLLEKQIPFVFRFYGDSYKKPLGHVFHCNIRLEDSVLCRQEECEFFRKYL